MALAYDHRSVQFISLKGSSIRGTKSTGLFKHCRYRVELKNFAMEFHCMLVTPEHGMQRIAAGAYVSECRVVTHPPAMSAPRVLYNSEGGFYFSSNSSNSGSSSGATTRESSAGSTISQAPASTSTNNTASIAAASLARVHIKTDPIMADDECASILMMMSGASESSTASPPAKKQRADGEGDGHSDIEAWETKVKRELGLVPELGLHSDVATK